MSWQKYRPVYQPLVRAELGALKVIAFACIYISITTGLESRRLQQNKIEKK